VHRSFVVADELIAELRSLWPSGVEQITVTPPQKE